MKFEGLKVFKEAVVRRPLQAAAGRRVPRESRFKKAFEKLQGPLRQPGVFPVDGLHEAEARSGAEGRRRGGLHGGGQAVLRRTDPLHGKRHDAGQGDPARGLHERGGRLQHRGLEALDPRDQPARLLQADGGGAGASSRRALGDDKLDVTFKVEEQNRNQFTLGGGVSELEGAFVNASFSTANFLGLGETVAFSAQTGQRSRNYQVAVTEPYFLDRPITAGFDVFLRRITYYSSQNFVGYLGAGPGDLAHERLPRGPVLAPLRELRVPDRRHLRHRSEPARDARPLERELLCRRAGATRAG